MHKNTQGILLEGVRVLDLADEKGTYTGRVLADLGADVVKVEPPHGDRARSYPPFAQDEPGPDNSLFFLFYNLNKRSVTLNLEHPQGCAIFRELVTKADVLVESFPVGYLTSLGVDYVALRQVNPRLVFASVSDFGQTGPCSRSKSSDLVNMAMSGHMQMCGEPGKPPFRMGMHHSYMAASLYAANGIVAALWYRHTSGKGQLIDVSAQEAMVVFAGAGNQEVNWFILKKNPARTGARHEAWFPAGDYGVKDGRVCIAVWSATEWDSFAQWVWEVTGNTELLDPKYKGAGDVRYPYIDYLSEILSRDFFPKFTKLEIFHESARRGIVVVPVQTVEDVVNDAQLNERGFFMPIEHPAIGKTMFPGMPFYIEGLPCQCRQTVPLLGQDNEDIYCGELGFSKQDLGVLKAIGAI